MQNLERRTIENKPQLKFDFCIKKYRVKGITKDHLSSTNVSALWSVANNVEEYTLFCQ